MQTENLNYTMQFRDQSGKVCEFNFHGDNKQLATDHAEKVCDDNGYELISVKRRQ
jgi:hypothetical protein